MIEGWGFVVFSIVFGAVGAFVFARKPDEPAAIPLLFITCAAAGSSVPWFLGSSVSDVVQGPQFLLFALLTGPLYMLLWPAASTSHSSSRTGCPPSTAGRGWSRRPTWQVSARTSS